MASAIFEGLGLVPWINQKLGAPDPEISDASPAMFPGQTDSVAIQFCGKKVRMARSPHRLCRWLDGIVERDRERGERDRTRKTDEQEERVDDRRTPWRGRSFARVESSMIVARELP